MKAGSLLSAAGQALGAVAPTVARALGGPLAGLATESLVEAFGVDSPDELDLRQLSADDIRRLQLAEMTLRERMRELDIEERQLDVQDRDSARARQIAMKDWSVNALAAGYVLGYFALLAAMALGEIPPEVAAQSAFEILLGALTAGLAQIMNYFFGSSRGSKMKTEAMAREWQPK